MRCWRWIGHSGISAVIAEQFGTAMIPRWSRMRPALISGITSGTFGSMRKAEELTMTTAPAFTAIGENCLETVLPAENSAMSTPAKESAFNSSMVISSPRKESLRPADRALASAFSLPTRKPRLSMVAMNSRPTAPVTPAMATTGSSLTSLSFGLGFWQEKSPGPSSGGARFGYAAVKFYARTTPEAPEGFLVFVVFFAIVIAGDHMGGPGPRQRHLRSILALAT